MKKINRKEFFKFSALGTVAGVGGTAVLSGLAREALASPHGSDDHNKKTGKRYGLVIDREKCTEGCNDCIEACHSVHNVPEFENKRHEIKWIWKEHFHNIFPGQENPYMSEQAVGADYLTLCNHCDNPPCVRVCPTQATFKNRENGIVMMDFHRCIGCRFCMAGCPYGSRSFNFRDPRAGLEKEQINKNFPTRTKGVVEKCNLCSEKLKKGELPACVQACKNGAIVFGDLNDPESEAVQIIKKNHTMRRKPELGTEPSVFYKM